MGISLEAPSTRKGFRTMQRVRNMLARRDWLKHPLLGALLEGGVVYAIAWFYLYKIQFASSALERADPHYHIKFAQLLRTEGLGMVKQFPWAQFSLWKEHFFDKDFGFHVLLMPFASGNLIYGGKLAGVAFGALVFGTFALVLRLRGVRGSWVWALGLTVASYIFVVRMNVARPQVFSITLTLLSLYFVLRRDWKVVFGLGIAYALSYTAPHLIVIYAGALLVSVFLLERRLEYKPLLASVAGVLVGWLVHPSFPNTFKGFWVQIVGVLDTAWGEKVENLDLAVELSAATTRELLTQNALLWVLVVLCVLLLPRVTKRLTAEHLTLFLVSCGFLALTAMSRRFAEYMVPVMLWMAAEIVELAFREADESRAPWFLSSRRSRLVATVLACSLVFVVFVRNSRAFERRFAASVTSPVRGQALWLAQNTEPGSVVFTCGWDTAPEMFLYNHHNNYLVFLDPNYMYQWNRELWQRWSDITTGKAADPVSDIVNVFGARYGYCHSRYRELRARLIRDPRVTFISENMGGVLFEIDPSVPAPPPQFRFVVSEPYPLGRNWSAGPPEPHAWTDTIVETRPYQRITLPGRSGPGSVSCVILRDTLELPPGGLRVRLGALERARVWYGGRLAYDSMGIQSSDPHAGDFFLTTTHASAQASGVPPNDFTIEICTRHSDARLSIHYDPLPAPRDAAGAGAAQPVVAADGAEPATNGGVAP